MFARHRRMKDVCVQVLDKTEVTGYVKLKVLWTNIANGEPFPMGSQKKPAIEELTIPIGIWQVEWYEQNEVFKYERS